MLGKIWNYFIPQTTIETELTKELSTLSLSGTLYLKKNRRKSRSNFRRMFNNINSFKRTKFSI